MSVEIENAIKTLSNAMNTDPDYARSWYDNISVMMQDAGCERDIANDGASRFMKLAFKIDVDEDRKRYNFNELK